MLRQSFVSPLGLTNEVKDPDRLEAAVHTLLSCAGYNCIFTGRAWGTQGIDTIAFPSSPGSIVAISITTSNDIREKVRMMLPQLTKLRNEQGGLQVASVIVASVEPTEVLESDRTDAAGHRIGLLLRPQLSEILDALLNQPQDRLADVVESMLGFGRRGAPSLLGNHTVVVARALSKRVDDGALLTRRHLALGQQLHMMSAAGSATAVCTTPKECSIR